jgi:uncharacterized damage-inducible protein DinB
MNDPFAIRPAADEYAEFYAGYVGQVPEGSVLDILANGIGDTVGLVAGLTEERGGHRYAPGKWSIKEVIGHLIDAERVFVFRLLCFARGDGTPLPGFEENDFVREGHFDRRPLADLAEEFRLLREANLRLFRSLEPGVLPRRGTANGKEVSVRALLFVMAGHEIHHQKVLQERYLR